MAACIRCLRGIQQSVQGCCVRIAAPLQQRQQGISQSELAQFSGDLDRRRQLPALLWKLGEQHRILWFRPF